LADLGGEVGESAADQMNANQQESDGATRVAYILGVPLAQNVVRRWPQMSEAPAFAGQESTAISYLSTSMRCH
jgi:hypothetical protein